MERGEGGISSRSSRRSSPTHFARRQRRLWGRRVLDELGLGSSRRFGGRWISSSPSKTGARRKSKPNAIHITPGLVKLSVRMFLNSPSMHAMTRRSFPIAWAPKLEIRRGDSLRGGNLRGLALALLLLLLWDLLAGVGQGGIGNRRGRKGIPEPSWCRAERVCGCGGTWGRYP